MELRIAIVEVVTGPLVTSLVVLMVANILLAIVAAIKEGTFSFRNLGDFVPNRLLPLVAYVILAVLARLVDGWQALAVATYAGLVSMYAAGILSAIKRIFNGNIPIPQVLTDKKEEIAAKKVGHEG